MSLYKELSYSRDFESVKGIQFCVMSPDEIRKRSVCEVTFNGNEAVDNGLFDPRMGVIDHNKICVTCHQKNTFCPGHFGHIELAKPVYHIHFFDMVKKILKCVCFRCSKLLINPDMIDVKVLKMPRQKRWDHVYKECAKAKRCGQFTTDGCGAKQPTVVKDGMLKIGFEWREVNTEESIKKQTLSADEVLQILKRISDRDAEAMGFMPKFNRPEWMICSVLPVPPPAVRPSVKTETGQRQEDDLTHKLLQIVKHNKLLQTKIAKSNGSNSNDTIDAMTGILQYEIATMIDNTHPSIPKAEQKTGRPIRSVTERLRAKEGRIRGNLMGKRVDYSARSVITPDPMISIDELGVPIKIAMNMTFPEIVTKYNKEEMLRLVLNGPDKYPGAKNVKSHKTGITRRLKNIDRNTIELEEGDIVERHMRNGDYVLFNRQPSLHKMSMMGHRVRVMPYNTFRLNVLVTPSYNADFDGDEMNAHLPQSYQTMEELKQLCSVPTQIISPRDCSPIISIVQDVCLGVYRLSKKHVRIPENEFFNLIASNDKFTGIIPKPYERIGSVNYYTGAQALSLIMPERLNTEIPMSTYDESKSKEENMELGNLVVIKNGKVICGTFEKQAYQKTTKGVVHSTFNEYGPEETRLLYDRTQKLACDFLVMDGFSVGVSDLIVEPQTKDDFKDIIHKMKVNAYDVIRKVHKEQFENNSTNNNQIMFESSVNNILNKANSDVGEKGLANINDLNNRMINMIKSKSKGNVINVAQMIGCVGQQNVDGRRIPYGFDDRTLPHYTKYDDGPESRGFVENSFISGLSPQEFFHHAMGGREGLIDTAVQTSEVGYVQRKLVKAMEDCKISCDGSVRNASGVIIQYLYGEDGMDACKLEYQTVPYIKMDPVKVKALYDLVDGINDFEPYMATNTFKSLQSKKAKIQNRMSMHYKAVMEERNHIINKLFDGHSTNVKIMYPVSFHRIITSMYNMYEDANVMPATDLGPEDVLDAIEHLSKVCIVGKHCKGNFMMQALLKAFLTPKSMICKYRFTKNAFNSIVEQIKHRFFESLASPGDMSGVVAAQSIGEPATQLVLNTFHSAGISSASATVRGVPRLNELLSVSKTIKTPQMTIYFNPHVRHDKEQCTKIVNSIRTVRFKDIVKKSTIYFDPCDNQTTISTDIPLLDAYNTFFKSTGSSDAGPWLLRLEMDKYKMLKLGLDMLTLYHTVDSFYEETVQCIFSDDNAENLVMRLRLSQETSTDMLTDIKALEHNVLETLVISGIKNVGRAALEEKIQTTYDTINEKDEKNGHKEWTIFTAGTNLREVLALPAVDATRTISNNINEIYEVFGIEAARAAMYHEITDLFGSSINVNYRHIVLLIDVMTNRGVILSVNRHGLNRGDIGPLAKCSFEETTDKIIKAGIFAEQDKINGVSANVMLGQIAPCGTGDTQIIVDELMLREFHHTTKYNYVEPYDDVELDFQCSVQNLAIQAPPKTIGTTINDDGLEVARKTQNRVIIH